MLSKKKLLSLVERKLTEMPIDYGDNPERMNPDLERKLANKETPYKDNPAIPQDEPGQTSNFEELISSKRFIDVVNKIKHYTGFESNITSQNSFVELRNLSMSAMMDVLQFESQNKEFLENLAVELVKKEMAIPENALQFDAKLVPIGAIGDEGFQKQSENPSDEEIEQQFGIDSDEAGEDLQQFVNAFDTFNDEVAKRRLLNAMIQGSSKKGHYMFELVNNKLNELDPTIIRKYGILMSVNDILYWLFPDEMMMGGGGGGFAGKEEVNKETDPPTVIARGVFFPVLVHELIKGIMDVLATKGLPDDPRSAEMVMGVADTLPAEIWDLRFGPIIWEKFIQSYPDRLFDEDKIHLQNYLFSRFSALSTDEFFKLVKMILKGDQMGKTILDRMVRDIEEHLRKEDYEEEEYNQEYGDDGLGGFLGSLGISLSDDEE